MARCLVSRMVVATPSTGRKIVKETATVLTHNTKWRIRLVTSGTKQKKNDLPGQTKSNDSHDSDI